MTIWSVSLCSGAAASVVAGQCIRGCIDVNPSGPPFPGCTGVPNLISRATVTLGIDESFEGGIPEAQLKSGLTS